MISGTTEAGFGDVADAFRQNFAPAGEDPGDLGAALAIIHEGRLVVDVWGGMRGPDGLPWTQTTLVNMYSVGKPVAAVVALDAVARGEATLDRPVAELWGDFGEHQPETTLRQLLSHQAGLPAVAEGLRRADIYCWQRMCGHLASTPPWWEPGTAHGYHVNTFGFLAGHLPVVRSGRSYRKLLQERVSGPLELDLHCGLAATDLARAASIDAPGAERSGDGDGWPTGTHRQRMLRAAYFNPPSISGMGVVNTTAWRQASVPSTNGHATARAVAGFYAGLLPSAPKPLLPTELIAEAVREHVNGDDLVLGRPTRFGLGFQLPQPERQVGVGPQSFGHFGFGGSLAFADPAHDLAFCYLLNRPGDRWQNPRTQRLMSALRRCVSATPVEQ